MTRGRAAVPPVVAPPPGNPRFGGLDALRGLAAIGVVMTHCAAYTDNQGGAAPELFYLRAGQLGLVIFFGLSGFLLFRPFFAARLEDKPQQSFGAYARRRALRVLPGYWLALTVLSLFVGLPGMFDSGWWKQYLFVGIFGSHALTAGLPQTWSLDIEVQLYVLLPVMVLGIGWVVAHVRRRAAPAAALSFIAALCLLGIGLQAVAYFGPVGRLPQFGPAYLWWFGAGMALAVLSVRPPRRLGRAVRWARGHAAGCWWLALAGFVLALWLGANGPVGDFGGQQFTFYVLAPLIAIPLMAPAIFVAEGGWPRRFMSGRRLRWLGLISYGIFLWHVGVLIALKDLGVTKALTPDGFIPLFALVLALSVGCAVVSYYWVERPFYALKDRRLRRPRAPKGRPARARAGA